MSTPADQTTAAGSPEDPGHRSGRGSTRTWRVATPLALGVVGVLVVTSAANSDGTDLRPGRYNDLGSVVSAENREIRRLQDRAGELSEEVEALGRQRGDTATQVVRDVAEGARAPAGLEPESGAGLVITLADAPPEQLERAEDPNRLVVHQQDIQAVVNAMWRGGAEAVTLQGRRIVTTTGIKCAGSTVQLQGLTFPQPYVIGAVGDPEALAAAIEDDDFVSLFRADAEDPAVDLGFDAEVEPEMTAPGYEGLLDVRYAEPTS